MDSGSKENVSGNPRFYHLELYDSLEDLELFPEEPFQRRDLSTCENLASQGEKKLTYYVDDHDHQPSNNTEGGKKKSSPDFTGNETSNQPFHGGAQYCITCCVPVTAFDGEHNDHREHEVLPLSGVVEIAKNDLQRNIERLEDQINHLESFCGHMEEIFITVEENFSRQEQKFEKHYNDIMQLLEQKYEENMQALGEEKKEKLEALYKQLVSCGENLDTCKDLMETIENLNKSEKKEETVKTAVATIHRLDVFLKKDVNVDLSTPAEFEARDVDFTDIQERMHSVNTFQISMPPSAPVMNVQDPNSATGTSVKVCWSFFSEDIVESYQLCYKRVSNDTSGKEEEEFKLNVRETYCTVDHLTPNAQYEFWVKAVNRAGVSSASERAVYMTAPLPPVIKGKVIQNCEHSALVQWESGNTNPVDSYTVELSKVTDGGETLTESVVGIPSCETLIQLEPRQNYLLFVKAINMGGSSERSEPVSILSTGTSFTLNHKTAHPSLCVLEDGLTLSYHNPEGPREDVSFSEGQFRRSIAILGHPILFRGKHYWEVDVEEDMGYCVGMALENVSRDDCLGMTLSSWCMRHTVILSSHRYEFLNDGVTLELRITVPPRRVGLLLDSDEGTLSFFNADVRQHLYTFQNCLRGRLCPCFAVEEVGVLRIRNGIPMPPGVVL